MRGGGRSSISNGGDNRRGLIVGALGYLGGSTAASSGQLLLVIV